MAISQEEKQLAAALRESGKTNTEVLRIIAKRRMGVEGQLPDPSKEQPVAKGGVLDFLRPTETTKQIQESRQQSLLPGAVKDIKTQQAMSSGVVAMGTEQQFAQDEERYLGLPIGELGGAAKKVVGNAAKKVVQPIADEAANLVTGVKESASAALETPAARGLGQRAKELFERIPRAIGRAKESVEESVAKAEKIKQAPPPIAQALKVDLPEKYINFAQTVDEPTRKAVLKVLDIADETPSTIGVKKNPTFVGGELASKQYDLISKQKDVIGKEIGKVSDSLPNSKVDMRPSLGQLTKVLADNGVVIEEGALDLSGSILSKAQGARLQELYDVATRGGGVLDAKMVHGLDRLFSQLQREARMEQLDSIFLRVGDKDINAFKLFRDIYRNQLDNLDPRIRELNKEYAKLSSLVDDIEDSIVKTPNFNVTKSADAAEFAKVNLRRIFGEAQSSPAYEAVADQMDEVARSLGYADAKPKDVAAFAQEIRELYKESVPRAGFAGGIRGAITDIAGKVLEAGKATDKDRRKALRALFEEALSTL